MIDLLKWKVRFAKKLRQFADSITPPLALAEPHPENRKRLDVCRFPIHDGAMLAVFWKNLPHGRGPAISLYVYQYEILRFDCFGGTEGHYHVETGLPQPRVGRIEFPEQDMQAQIDRAHFELLNNTIMWQSFHPDCRVRALKIDEKKLRKALDDASSHISKCFEVSS